MPIKHQASCYQSRKGVRFECFEDLADLSKGDLHWQAKEMLRGFRENGRQAFYEKHDGYYRVFVAEAA